MTILVATDFSDNSLASIRLGARLAREREQVMVLFHAVDIAVNDNAWRVLVEAPQELESSAVEEAKQLMKERLDDALAGEPRPAQVQFEVTVGNPIDEILSLAETLSDPLIVAGTRGKSRLQEFFLGSTARRLVRKTRVAVILTPPDSLVEKFDPIVVAVDMSAASREALRRAADFARKEGTTLRVVHGFMIPEVTALQVTMASVTTELDAIIKAKEGAINDMIEEEGLTEMVAQVEVVQMPPAAAILTTVDQESSPLVFLGTHGRQGWSRFFFGNTAERVFRRAPCPLFVVPAPLAERE